MKFLGISLGSELNELKKFESLEQKERQIVFYSENKNSLFIFESLIDELISNHNCSICYVTSSKDEPILKTSNKKIKTFCIGEGIARTKFFLNLKADILIMTMPDLETFHIKRSKIYPVHYVYIFHSMISTHLGYRKEAFDHFDSIFCVGDYQIKEIRSAERIYGLKPKNLIPFGYNHLDNLIIKYSNIIKSNSKNQIQILIAPSWGEEGLFEKCGDKIISLLLELGYKIIFRPHPMTRKKSIKKIHQIEKSFASNHNFILEEEITNFDSFLFSDLMISDWSGAALEYAFTLEKPILYVDVPKKNNNPNFLDIPHIPIEESIRDKIGEIISVENIELIPIKIEELLKKSDFWKSQIKKVKNETIFNINKSDKIGAKEIMKILNQLND
jgi:hypothetical protein|tara:strand:+ start:181 stop:1341 length:1161 start_codon:yes stop_codon:yes gene_type:complete